MSIQFSLMIISFLLILLLGLLIWVIRIALNKKQVATTQESATSLINNPQPPIYDKLVKPKYPKSNLQNTEKERLVQELLSYMEKEKAYRQPNLTISQLAKNVGIPKHHLSQLINEQLSGSFLDFVNRYRIAEAKERLQNKDAQTVSNIEIGRQVGFNAKSTFYATFKRYTNQTPGDFRKAVKEDSLRE